LNCYALESVTLPAIYRIKLSRIFYDITNISFTFTE